MQQTMKSLVLGAAMLALLATGTAEARTKRIWPDQLQPMKPGETYWVMPTLAMSSSAGQGFWAPVSLPAGSRITSIVYYHANFDGVSLGDTSEVTLYRTKMGVEPENLGEGSCGPLSSGTLVPVTISSFTDPVIRAGYRYFLLAIPSANAGFGGIEIHY
jgi:hypothetical protein